MKSNQSTQSNKLKEQKEKIDQIREKNIMQHNIKKVSSTLEISSFEKKNFLSPRTFQTMSMM